ncbi:MAG TPA: 2,3-diketo-5-methylthio-1-phosphopentane phosphatase [Planctomycetaceae bacterium]|jgi:2-hydroxy-3-keto-5-methylthiopentenyl-1-phosphate phosphatase|nr:2,3-diketo-5-methylthio-1-phosphopentane phosphatase [Planctomycetaceae bacterium]
MAAMNLLSLAPKSETRKVLVSDFDGTLWSHDYYLLFTDRYGGPQTLQAWHDYRRGEITHFEAMRRIYAAAAPGEESLRTLLHDHGLGPHVREGAERLQAHGWSLVVVSAGSLWYIEQLLAEAGIEAEVHSNPGSVIDGRLCLRRPEGTPYPSHQNGIDKGAVVRVWQERGCTVAFSGDGYPDVEPARLVPPELRFARGYLAEELTMLNESFLPFQHWGEVCDHLTRPVSRGA